MYDISLDGTVVNALGMNIVSNTDGFNFGLPEKHRYSDDNPYIGLGRGRNVKEGKAYTGVDADVAEFEDLFMHNGYYSGVNKMGLGVDEYCDACVNFSRKNYADLMPDGSIKLVGNSIKSKKMPKYIEKFLDVAIRLLLEGKGREFLNTYYDYVEKIYNLQIPLKEIATVGKIKTSIDNYVEKCGELTAGGTKKSRQAWYELAIKHKLNVNMGDEIFYINTGKKKSDSDVKRVTHYYARIPMLDGTTEEVEVTKELERNYNKERKANPAAFLVNGVKLSKADYGRQKYGPSFREEDEVLFNCVLLSNDIVEDDDDHFCDENFEYNVDKYVEMFNKRIRPLLVCFDRSIRTRANEKGKEVDNILVSKPEDRKEFTDEECQLVSGQPYNPGDQDTYEQLMTMEDKEIKFWTSVDKVPPYVKECGMDWDQIKEDYFKRMKELEREEIQNELRMFDKAIEDLTYEQYEAFLEDGTVPTSILAIADEDVNSNNFVSRKYGVKLGDIFDIIDKVFSENE